MLNKLLSLLLLFSFVGFLSAQNSSEVTLAKQELMSTYEKYGLDRNEIDNFIVSDHYVSSYHNATHLYLMQTHDGIPVYNGIITFGMKDGKIYNIASNAVRNLSANITSSDLVLSPEAAIRQAGVQLGFPNNESFNLIETKRANSYVFAPASFASNNIPVYLCYEKTADGSYVLAWNVDLDIPGSDYWSTRIDAKTGKLITKNNYTVYCSFDHDATHTHSNKCKEVFAKEEVTNETNAALVTSMMEGSYRVYPLPAESPNHGEHELVVNPADVNASPFGWHDTDGAAGAEYTTTRGNNVHAYLDIDGDNNPDGNEPDGGAELIFDFEHNKDLEPASYQAAATTNLFYMNNMIHDFTYRHGFDEVAGNFQENNYGNGGAGSDYVLAEAQDGSGTNNANFATPGDGSSGRMQMFLWGASEFDLLTVLEPSQLAGKYEVRAAAYGAAITDVPVTGNIVIARDGTNDPTTACEDLINGNDISGNIALIDRGTCDFSLKTFNAQNAGAIAVIVCNIPGVNGGDGSEIIQMGAGDNAADVNIPAIMATYQDCLKLRASIDVGVPVEATIQLPQVVGPMFLDGDFDNGIVAHEFGHGVSNRLTGGPTAAGCLGNDEQMGEGWSDFFSLVTTVEPGDLGIDARGIGTYASSEQVTGGGIRDFPYSTDISISPKTYDNIIGTTAPHPLGEVWAACLWDVYWGMVDEYGYDADINNQESGNAKAIRLVIEGMKEQQCSPGFVSGRDGIIAADLAMFPTPDADYQSENFCIIYSAFARRGVGFDANEMSTDNRGDGIEGFINHPDCLDEIVINKESSDIVKPGEEFLITIEVTNYKRDEVTDLVVTDEIPEGATYVDGSSNITGTVSGDVVTFEIGEMAREESVFITYSLLAGEAKESITYIIDDMETSETEDNWDLVFNNGNAFWELTDDVASSGELSWAIESVDTESDNELIWLNYFEVQGERPVLKFNTRYNTQPGNDGGFIAVQEEGENSWTRLGFDKNIRNGMNIELGYGTAFAFASLAAFSGESNGFVDTYIDLTEYKGKKIRIQFRFGTDETISAEGDFTGWAIDDFEILDLKDYAGTACATTGEDEPVCAGAITVVESNGMVGINNANPDDFGMQLFPNPAENLVNVRVSTEASENATLSIFSVDGNTVYTQSTFVNQGTDMMKVNVGGLTRGIYFVQLKGETNVSIKRLILN